MEIMKKMKKEGGIEYILVKNDLRMVKKFEER